MVRLRRDRAPEVVDRLDLRRLHGTSRDDVLVEGAAVVRDPHRAIDPFFHHDVSCSDIALPLVEVPVVRHGPVTA